MRRLPEERSGTQTEMWLAAGSGARAAAGGVGAKANRRGRMSTIVRHGGERSFAGRISCVPGVWLLGCECDAGTLGGRHLRFGTTTEIGAIG